MDIDPVLHAAQQQALAAWVQAIGSVVAILASGAFPLWHLHVAASHRQRQLVSSLQGLAIEVEQMARYVHEAMRDGSRYGTAMHSSDNEYEPLLATLERFPAQELKSRVHLIWWINFMRYAKHADRLWRYVIENGTDETMDWTEWREAAEDLMIEVAGARTAMK